MIKKLLVTTLFLLLLILSITAQSNTKTQPDKPAKTTSNSTSYRKKDSNNQANKRSLLFDTDDLGTFSVSLTVKDIAKSKAFYEKLGFKHLNAFGSVKMKWLILSKGTTKIGLFQGFFPRNTMTFNPTDARSFYRSLKKKGVKVTVFTGKLEEKGPFSFTFADPDGNPILIDQHK